MTFQPRPAPGEIAHYEFVFRFRERLELKGGTFNRAGADGYFRDRKCEPEMRPEDWADAHFLYGDS